MKRQSLKYNSVLRLFLWSKFIFWKINQFYHVPKFIWRMLIISTMLKIKLVELWHSLCLLFCLIKLHRNPNRMPTLHKTYKIQNEITIYVDETQKKTFMFKCKTFFVWKEHQRPKLLGFVELHINFLLL